jgi:hypothetical protein
MPQHAALLCACFRVIFFFLDGIFSEFFFRFEDFDWFSRDAGINKINQVDMGRIDDLWFGFHANKSTLNKLKTYAFAFLNRFWDRVDAKNNAQSPPRSNVMRACPVERCKLLPHGSTKRRLESFLFFFGTSFLKEKFSEAAILLVYRCSRVIVKLWKSCKESSYECRS